MTTASINGERFPAKAPRTLEICVDDVLGLGAAAAGGADRIELCSALALGGLTPSAAMVSKAVATGVPIHVMIRPRAGDFTYDQDEVALMERDITNVRLAGAAGVVVGASDPNGRLNLRALERFREAADGLKIVLHRVIDITPSPVDTVRTAANLGYDYALTSGGAPSAFQGREVLREMAAEAGALTIIAGGGVTAGIVVSLMRDTGVTEIHASATRPREWTQPRLEEFGFAAGPRRIVDQATVEALKHAIEDA